MRYTKAMISIVLCMICVSIFCMPTYAFRYQLSDEIESRAYYLYNMDTKQVVDEKNMHQKMYPASLTKIMTVILAMENTANLDTEKCKYPNYVQDYLYTYQLEHGAVSLAGLTAGEELSMRQLIYACMLPSANEAAMIIADHIGGSQEEFAKMMTKRAKELGASHTNFVNANGLHNPNHYTTAYDMAVIAKHAMEIPGFMEIVATSSYSSGPTNKRQNAVWNTTIKMQIPSSELYLPGLKGIKTGSVPEAGDCFVSTCTRDGFTYLLVLMGAEYLDEDGNYLSVRGTFRDATNIYTDVFENLRKKTLIDQGAREAEIPLRLSFEKDTLTLMAGERLTALVPKITEASDLTTKSDLPEYIKAPIEKGDYVGDLYLYLGGEEIGKIPLLAGESVKASTLLIIGDQIKMLLNSFWFKFIMILTLFIVGGYVGLMILRNRNKNKKNYRPRRRL